MFLNVIFVEVQTFSFLTWATGALLAKALLVLGFKKELDFGLQSKASFVFLTVVNVVYYIEHNVPSWVTILKISQL